MAKCKKCNKPVKVIRFVETAKDRGAMFYKKNFKDVKYKCKERESLMVEYYCNNCNSLLTLEEDEALEFLEKG